MTRSHFGVKFPFIFDLTKSYASSNLTGQGKSEFLEDDRPFLDFQSEIEKRQKRTRPSVRLRAGKQILC